MSIALPRLGATALLASAAILAQAQEGVVRGVVTDEDKKSPIEGAVIRVSGTNAVAVSSATGAFTIKAAKGARLVISSVGFEERTVTAGTGDVRITLKARSTDLEEVVVAMDRKLKARELGFSNQSVGGKDLRESQRENIVNGLQGRVAGLTVSPTSGVAGASSAIVLRGFNSLSLSNQPLFVVDGIILDNSTVDENSNGGSGIGLASDRPNRNNDYTNRIADINPNDIESVTVLKGPEATALYGSQASSGAIVITTRKAKSNKLAVQYDNSFRITEITRIPKTFNGFNPGRNGSATNVFTYFGPIIQPESQPYFDNIGAFFKTGFAQTHNLGVDFGFKNSVFRVSASVFDQDGVVPNNTYNRYNFRISNTTKFGKWADVTPSFSYIYSDNDKPLRSTGGYLTSLLLWPTNIDIRRYKDDAGNKLGTFASTASNAEIDNPLFNTDANRSRDQNWRGIGTLAVNIYPTKWLTLAGRFGYDAYNADGYTLYHPQSFYISSALRGSLDNYYRKYRGYNHTITATARRNFGKFGARLLGGTMWQDYEMQAFSVTGNTLTDVNRTDSANTAPGSRVRLAQNNFGLANKSITRQFAVFGEVALSYNNLLFLTYSHRFEQASTLPAQNRNYDYPGASVSLIVSDVFPALKKGNVLNYWKLRGSTASTARLNTPYSTQSVFVNNFASFNPQLFQIFSYGFTNANPDLMPEKQNTYEVGTEMKFAKSRIGLDFTYYNTLCKDQIIENFRLSYGTGFVLNTQNAGSTRNQGVEIVLDVTPVAKTNFNWNMRFNFNKMWNKVEKLPPSVLEYYIADTWVYANARAGIVLGQPTTTITAFGYKRNNNGDLLISPTTGFPQTDGVFTVRGDRNPDFTLGTLNTFRYKNWNLSFLWDLKVGGDIYNGTKQYLTGNGRSEITADRLVPRVVQGVLEDGLQNTATPTRNNISVIPYYNDLFYAATAMPEEAFIEKDVNWLRLRDVTLSYTFPQQTRGFLSKFKSLALFGTLNDAVLITNYSGADPSVSGNTAGTRGVGSSGFDFGSLPTPVSANFGLRAGF